MRQTLSDHAVKALKAGLKRYTVADPELRGHWVAVQPTGSKSYIAVTRNPDGKQIWTTIGATDAMPIAKAREEARNILIRVRAGLPATEPKAETFADVLNNWFKRHVEAHGVITGRNIRYVLDACVLPVWKDRPFTSIRRSDLAALLDQVEDRRGASMAEKVHKFVRAIMIWQASRTDDYNPPIARGMAPFRPPPRARILNDDEIAAFWSTAASFGTYGAMAQMCLLTAQRLTKVSSMRWDAIEDGAWTVPHAPREKGVGGVLVLPEMALAILATRPKLASNPYVFAGRWDGPWRGFTGSKRLFDARLPPDMPPWTIHDLRRTARSLMSRAGVASEHAERVLGHVQKGVEGVYDRHLYRDEKAAALAKLARLIETILNPPEPNVVPIRRQELVR